MIFDAFSRFAGLLGSTLMSMIKVILLSRRPTLRPVKSNRTKKIIVMGNGPSLRTTIADHLPTLQSTPTIAVNFAANASEEFNAIKPRYYVLMDPHFFDPQGDPNVERLIGELEKVDWPMTLITPVNAKLKINNQNIDIKRINTIGVEGFSWFTHWCINRRRGMPRPRNVLISAIMAAIWLGYGEIDIVGADHSWMKTLSVNDQNQVISVQPHFYKDNDAEHRRVASVYSNVKLHEMIDSMRVAFAAYWQILDYATTKGITIINSTPDSFIDAFPRRPLS